MSAPRIAEFSSSRDLSASFGYLCQHLGSLTFGPTMIYLRRLDICVST